MLHILNDNVKSVNVLHFNWVQNWRNWLKVHFCFCFSDCVWWVVYNALQSDVHSTTCTGNESIWSGNGIICMHENIMAINLSSNEFLPTKKKRKKKKTPENKPKPTKKGSNVFVSPCWLGCEWCVEFPASSALCSRSTQPVLQQEVLLQMRPPQLLQLLGALFYPLCCYVWHSEGWWEGHRWLPVLRPPHSDMSAVCRQHPGIQKPFFCIIFQMFICLL